MDEIDGGFAPFGFACCSAPFRLVAFIIFFWKQDLPMTSSGGIDTLGKKMGASFFMDGEFM